MMKKIDIKSMFKEEERPNLIGRRVSVKSRKTLNKEGFNSEGHGDYKEYKFVYTKNGRSLASRNLRTNLNGLSGEVRDTYTHEGNIFMMGVYIPSLNKTIDIDTPFLSFGINDKISPDLNDVIKKGSI